MVDWGSSIFSVPVSTRVPFSAMTTAPTSPPVEGTSRMRRQSMKGNAILANRPVGLPGCAQSMWSRMRFGFPSGDTYDFGFIIS